MIDHSLTYKTKSLRNIPHIIRLKKIIKLVKSLAPKRDESYLDIGCSNGYLTKLIRSEFHLGNTSGLDHTIENLEIAKIRYPEIKFDFVDLNKAPISSQNKFKIITCFETLEHVGDLNHAIGNIISYSTGGSRILVSVPIEIGVMGVFKFLIKTLVFNYSLKELPESPGWWKYCRDLVTGKRISNYRVNREGWGTHFGFDYREVDYILQSNEIQYEAFNSFSTRFYIIKNLN